MEKENKSQNILLNNTQNINNISNNNQNIILFLKYKFDGK